MRTLTEKEADDIINLAYAASEKYILNHVSKKEFENIAITINLDAHEDSFDINIDIDLDTDTQLPNNLADEAIDLSLKAVDEYVENLED